MKSLDPLPSLLIIPTGIGCNVGGYAGDAIPSARLLAAASECLITHPNVMNGAALFWNDQRIQYVEGFGIDRFTAGEILLRPVRKQKVGVLLDVGIETELLQRHFHVLDACKATLGIDIGPVVTTEIPLEVSLETTSSGSSSGVVNSPETLLRAGEKLKKAGASAIAIVTRFPDDCDSKELCEYRKGQGVDKISGAEAVISHLLVRHLCIPCAHAPALLPLPMEKSLDPRAAAEELSYTFLTCVLVGLSRAPDLIPINELTKTNYFLEQNLINVDDLGAVIVPDGALGGESVLACCERGVPLIIVSNPGILNVDLHCLGGKDLLEKSFENQVYYVENYIEAAGLLLALREGLSISSLERPLKNIMHI